jgi:hypothetical protein
VHRFAERYMASDERVVGVGIGELEGREVLEVQVTELDIDLPETFEGIPVIRRRFPPEADLPPEVRELLEQVGIDPDAPEEDSARPGPLARLKAERGDG